jgi:hypothetical protein
MHGRRITPLPAAPERLSKRAGRRLSVLTRDKALEGVFSRRFDGKLICRARELNPHQRGVIRLRAARSPG